MDYLEPEGARLEFVKRMFGISTLADLGNTQLMERYLPLAKFLFMLENYQSENFESLTLPVFCCSLIFGHC